ncbi:MAG TPA: hypothetical protein VIL55_07360 [Naasia sp.]|jgi:hypothetical protein
MITDRHTPRVTVAAGTALLALAAAFFSVASAPVPPTGAEAPSTSQLTGFQLPTLPLTEVTAAE